MSQIIFVDSSPISTVEPAENTPRRRYLKVPEKNTCQNLVTSINITSVYVCPTIPLISPNLPYLKTKKLKNPVLFSLSPT